MKKKQNNSARALALQIALVVALISASAVLLAESFTPQFSQRATASAARTAPVMSPIEKPAAIFTVTNTNDSGPGSLRQAITDADNMPDLDTIEFNIPSNDPGCNPTTQVCTITLGSALPFLQTPMIIDGYTQPGAQPNTNETGGLNTVLKIELSGGASSKGFVIIFTSDVTVRGLVINHCSATAIECDTNFPNIHIEGNFIGTDASGTQAESTGIGITIQTAGNAQSFIGGPNAAARNLISGNSQFGIFSEGNFNGSNNYTVQGNLIGTDVSGQSPLGNGIGITVNIFTPTTFVAQGNVISGNTSDGIQIGGEGTSFSGTVQGNLIGVAADGVGSLGNGQRGIDVNISSNTPNLIVGGTDAGQGNIIAFNNDQGVVVLSGTGIKILGNSIFSNGSLGIDLSGDGVTPNDECDTDNGPNHLQNYPVITSVTATESSTHIQGMLDSAPNTTFTIDFYANADCNASGNGEGRTYLGSAQVTTNAGCTATIDTTLPVGLPQGQSIVTATATDPNNNTSEFSQCVSALQLTAAASRKTHGSAGTFDINLPLMGEPGVECRTGGVNGNHTLVFTFSDNVVSGDASVTSGTGNVSGSPIFSGNTMTVNLAGVTDAQTITITLTNVTDSFGHVLPPTAVSMNVLLGDTTGNGVVNASDIAQTKAQSGNSVTNANFREDVTVNGVINAGDIALVKSRSGTE